MTGAQRPERFFVDRSDEMDFAIAGDSIEAVGESPQIKFVCRRPGKLPRAAGGAKLGEVVNSWVVDRFSIFGAK